MLGHRLERSAQAVSGQSPLLADARSDLQRIILNLRDVCFELRSPVLEDLGLATALQEQIERGLPQCVTVSVEGVTEVESEHLSPEAQVCLYRVLQEALTNVSRHSRATQVAVRLSINAQEVMLEVKDNGAGFAAPTHLGALTRANHFGLAGMADRVEMLGGRLEIEALLGAGACVRARLPLNPLTLASVPELA